MAIEIEEVELIGGPADGATVLFPVGTPEWRVPLAPLNKVDFGSGEPSVKAVGEMAVYLRVQGTSKMRFDRRELI